MDFAHPALFYHSRQEYLDALVPFVLEALAKAHPVLVAVPTENLAALRDALGDAAACVTMVDMTEAGRNPGRSAVEYPACVQHEALINKGFDGRELTVLCPYDASRLGARALADARATHPTVCGERARNAEYAPDAALARYNRPLPSDPTAAVCTVSRLSELTGARSFAARFARWLRLSPDTVADLQLIASELVTNSLQHTSGVCRLALWRHGGHLVCEARDFGRLADPLAGRRAPVPGETAGHGLFLINEIAELVRTHTSAEGTTTQAYLRLPEPA